MPQKKSNLFNWSVFIILCFIWGSSFILMKEGMKELSAYQVASIRILSAGLILLPFSLSKFRTIPRQYWRFIFLSAMLGSFIPAFLFCIAQTRITSSLAGFLNALTPIFTIVVGILVFNNRFQKNKWPGVLIGFAGMVLLFLSNLPSGAENLWFTGFVVLATMSYAMNLNVVNRYLKTVPSLDIASLGFGFLIIPMLIVLFFTGFFSHNFSDSDVLVSLTAASTLGVFGTAIASVLFYVLIKSAGTVFSSMVTYGIPFVALFWGVLDGEEVTVLQFAGLTTILFGVYLAKD
jgi:drug/metabolite transporter (DMT)-like permease